MEHLPLKLYQASERLKAYARIAGSFAIAFRGGRPTGVSGQARETDYALLLEDAGTIFQSTALGEDGIVLVSPEGVRVAYKASLGA
ncbi:MULTISPECIES: hypothetical protein [unclassified Thermus]|jgi:hypothetical protein|uniref:hypothetical protein n=1 Tax=unclassified Thermus TaxID=2619321 RepID=UPI0003DBB865|nr:MULTISPECIES: hypothetical protein [unclassified Thermus]ETN89246.1 hypothetical protein TNMX_02685 [Thermus sp. NMX2.A1]